MPARALAVLALGAIAVEAALTVTEFQLERTNVSSRIAAAVAANATGNLRRAVAKPLIGDPKVHEGWDYPPRESPDVVEKYTKAESVQQVLFVMACKAKHKNDIDGMARDAAKQEGFTEKEFQAYVMKLQGANVAEMKQRCTKINSKFGTQCLADCTERWAKGGAFSLQMEKSRCVERCNQKHTAWEAECALKVDELQNVFVQEQGNLANTKKCQQIHCREFPAVLMMKDDEAKTAIEDGCKDMCTEEAITARCAKRWGLNMDTMSAQWQEECQEDTKEATLKPCVEKGTKGADDELKTCKDDGHKTCGEEKDKCLTDAKAGGEDTMVGAHADSICGVRANVCDGKVDEDCASDHKKALAKMNKECKDKHKEKSKKCFEDKLKEGETSFKDECKAEVEPNCDQDCKDGCQLEEMRKCQEDMLKKAFGVTQEYCTKLWQWVFDSEQYDKHTMDPIPKSEGGGRFKNIERKKLG